MTLTQTSGSVLFAPEAAFVEDVKRRWRGDKPDAAAVLRDHPHLLRYRSIVIDLAYEEYCLLEEAGDTPDGDAFANRFPSYRSGIRDVVRGHVWFGTHPDLVTTWPQMGETLEGYCITHEIARGAFARVYLAADTEVGRHVVLKVAPGGSTEARALGRVRHPHVIEVYWARATAGRFVLCMPFVGVATLQDLCEVLAITRPRSASTILSTIRDAEAGYAGLLPPPGERVISGRESFITGVVAISARIAAALAALHRAGVVHADLKPSNIVLAAGGMPYLIDFNLAIRPGIDLLRCGGTLPYMPPEQLRGLTTNETSLTEVTPQTDVYSFGAILHQLLTGRLPFEPTELSAITPVAEDLIQKQSAGYDRRQLAANGVTGPLADVIARCLSADPAHRPANADRLTEELQQVLQSRSSRIRRLRQVLAGAAAAVAFTTGCVAVSMLGRTDPPTAPVETGIDTPIDHIALAKDHLRRGHTAVALTHFQNAHDKNRDPRIMAYIAYCYGLLDFSAVAIDTCTMAIRDGCDTPAVRTNRASATMRQSGLKSATDSAIDDLRNALARDPNLRAAHYNLALAYYRRDLDQESLQLASLDCLEPIERMLAGEPKTAQLHVEAALMYASASRTHPEFRGKAVVHVKAAFDLGRNASLIYSHRVLRRTLRGYTTFDDLEGLTPQVRESRINLYVVDPERNEW